MEDEASATVVEELNKTQFVENDACVDGQTFQYISLTTRDKRKH